MRKAISVKGFQRRSRQFSLSILDRFGTSVLLIGSNFFTFNCKWYITTFDVPIICFTEIIQSWDFSNTISNFLTSNNYIPTSNAQLYSAVTKPQFDQIASSLAWWCFDELWFPEVVLVGGFTQNRTNKFMECIITPLHSLFSPLFEYSLHLNSRTQLNICS